VSKRFVFIVALLVSITGPANAQPAPEAPTIRFNIVPLTVDKGFPLQVMLTEKLKFKLKERVHGRIIEPVYAFDRVVIPLGTEVEGTITGFNKGSKWKKVSSLLVLDFTPERYPQISFDTLVLEDGRRIPIETSVEPGTDVLVRFSGDIEPKNESVSSNSPASNQISGYANARRQAGNDLVKGMLWNLAPYRPQALPAGLRYKATLQESLDLGTAVLGVGAFDKIGSELPLGSTIYARLETPLNSRTAKLGTPVKAFLTNPMFSWDHRLIFPVGSRLSGEVVEVARAGRLKHNGELAFKFTQIEPPVSVLFGLMGTQEIDGQLLGVQVSNELSRLRIDGEGGTRIAQSKERFVAPALALLSLGRGFNADAQSFGNAFTGAYSGNLLSRLLVGNSGLGLGIPAGIAGRMIPPVGIGLSLFSAARSLFVNILARGQEIDFPVNTPIEIRVDASR
jgi:hypothetical protein